MNNQKTWKEILESKKSVLLLLVLAIVSSTLYAIYLKQHQQMDLTYLEQYLKESDLYIALDLKSISQVFISYFKRYVIVWLMGGIVFLAPAAIGISFMELFAYGFSMTSLYLEYGIKGVWMAGGLFLLQGTVFCVLLLEIVEVILKRKQFFSTEITKSYGVYLLKGVSGCVLVVLLEIIVTNLV
ncbi:MAG: hypothetical protein E7231_00665 [Cellulosilyticum sp.]|nr:hypothetical protein [Cellulosilyticum sp.]